MKRHSLSILIFLVSFLQGYSQYDSLMNSNFNERLRILSQTCDVYSNAGDSVGFYQLLADIEQVAEKKGEDELILEMECARFRFLMHRQTRDIEQITDLYERIERRAAKQKNTQVLALVEFLFGTFWWNTLVNYEIAFAHFYRNYEYLEKLDDSEYSPKQYQMYTLGEKYFYFGDYPNAAFYLKKAEKIRNAADYEFLISIYNTLGMTYQGLELLDSSNYFFHKSLKIAEELQAEAWIANVTGNIGGNYLKQGNSVKAAEWLRKDVTLSLKRGNLGSAAGALMMLANLNFNDGHESQAVLQVDSVQKLMGGNRPPNRLKTLYPLLAKVAAYQGNWKLAAAYLDSSLSIRDTISKRANALHLLRAQQKLELEKHQSEVNKFESNRRLQNLQRNGLIVVVLLLLGGGALVLRQKRKTDNARKRSEELLLNILPSDVATELKANGSSRARKFNDVTVLFSDFKDFTKHSESLGPEELVNILDIYFKGFDAIITRFGLEKIKTVGDAYICAAGLPNNDSEHAVKMVRVALAMQEFMRDHAYGWQLRIGIHSGPVVAGIVGVKKFAYDIWGDTVNTAARMEQNSEAGKINVSQATYELVKDHFCCEHRGKIEAKNKGAIDMYYITQ